jgi:hypothetical protein
MTLKLPAIGAIAALYFAGFGPTIGHAQGPMSDRANVKLPYTVTLGDTTIPPGEYSIRELPSNTKQRVLLIYSENGKSKYTAHALTIPTLTNDTPDTTKLTLHHYGNDYYFFKLWISGKNYGYEFINPEKVQSRQQETVAMRATYTPPVAAPEPAPPPEPVPEPVPEVEPAPPPEANREEPPPPAMPKTASDWTLMLIAGASLASLGLALRRLGSQAEM